MSTNPSELPSKPTDTDEEPITTLTNPEDLPLDQFVLSQVNTINNTIQTQTDINVLIPITHTINNCIYSIQTSKLENEHELLNTFTSQLNLFTLQEKLFTSYKEISSKRTCKALLIILPYLQPVNVNQIIDFLRVNNKLGEIIKVAKDPKVMNALSDKNVKGLLYTFNSILCYRLCSKYKSRKIHLITLYDIINQDFHLRKRFLKLFSKNNEQAAALIQSNKLTEEKANAIDNIQYDVNTLITVPNNIQIIFINDSNKYYINKLKDYEYISLVTQCSMEIEPVKSAHEECDIIVIGCKDFVLVLDVNMFNKTDEYMDMFINAVKGKVIITFEMENNITQMKNKFKTFFENKDNYTIIDYESYFPNNNNNDKKSPKDKLNRFNTICKNFLNKTIEETYTLANWKVRPLRKGQLAYCGKEAYALLMIYDCLNINQI